MSISSEDRIELLRSHALTRPHNNITWRYNYETAFLSSFHTEAHLNKRHGMAVRDMLANAVPVIDAWELIVGKPSNAPLSEEQQREWEQMCKYAFPARPRLGGQASHMAVDYDLLLEKGVAGIAADIKKKLDTLDPADPDGLKKITFCESCLTALSGLVSLSNKYADYAAELAEAESDSERRAELLLISEVCRNVPEKPAGSFREAVQSVHFLTFCISNNPFGLYQLGRPDRYLYRYYRNDIDSGRITKEQAQLLIDCLGILYNEYIGSGLAVGLMVGGRDETGADVTNELTYMFIESIAHVRMIYPGVGLCYNSCTPDDLLRLSCRVLSEGHSHPALFNDDVIIKGLMHYGLPYRDACRYIHSTCVEITPVASSACWVASPYTNLPQLLLDTLNINGEPVRFSTYGELEDAYFRRLSAHIRGNLINENRAQMERTAYSFDPLLSCFVNDCLEKCVDIEHGGARYNWIMPSFVGVANLADALHAIEKLVFTEKRFDLYTLAEMLKADFSGYETQRALILNKVEKYGNDDEEADAYVKKITGFLTAECEKYKTYRGGRLVPSLFCWIMHEQFGTHTMATPDGRRAGFPLGDGSGPAQGREKMGATASILSSTKWEHYPFVGGIAVNMKFSKKLFREEQLDSMTALVKTFMDRGGFELQINVVDRDTLLKAKEQPELYRDLVVRIGGYSDFFVRLSPAMQAEVIERSSHML